MGVYSEYLKLAGGKANLAEMQDLLEQAAKQERPDQQYTGSLSVDLQEIAKIQELREIADELSEEELPVYSIS